MAKPIFTNEPAHLVEGYASPYVPETIKGPRDLYAASLHVLFKHVADMHITVLEILGEKYGIPVDDMLKTIYADTRYTDMTVHPVLNGLGYIPTTTDTLTNAMSSMDIEDGDPVQEAPKEAPKEPKKVTIRKKKIVIPPS